MFPVNFVYGDTSNCYEEGYQDGNDGASRKTKSTCQDSYNEGYDESYDGREFDTNCDYWKKNNRDKYEQYCI